MERGLYQVQQINYSAAINRPIPVPLEDARFSKPERIIIEAHFWLMVVPLKTNVTTSMFYSYFPQGIVYKGFMLLY
jgi:hypothetical protein